MTHAIASSLIPPQNVFFLMTPVILLMEEIRLTSRHGKHPSIYKVSCMSGGAGFLLMDDFMVIFQRL